MPAKKSSPSTATGTPRNFDHSLVVTLRQLRVAFSGQASVVDELKCSYVR
jgi:hypothetical protein